MLRSILVFVLLTAETAVAETRNPESFEALLTQERVSLSETCKPLKFFPDFLDRPDINGDGREDAVINYGGIECNGTSMQFCGTGGCSQFIYLQMPDGSFRNLGGEFLVFGFSFEGAKANPPFFVSAMHGSACDRPGTEICEERYEIKDGKAVAVPSMPAGGNSSSTSGTWEFSAGPPATAGISLGDNAFIDFECRGGASLRLTYSADWMFEPGGLFAPATTENDSATFSVTLEIDGWETTRTFGVDQMDQLMTPVDAIPLSDPLLQKLRSGLWLTIHHGGDIALERQFPLAGASDTIGGLLAACR